MSDKADLLSANEAFYHAFRARDMMAMDAAWSKSEALTCIHPGWQPLFGRAAVLQSWVGILGNPVSPEIACVRPQVVVLGDVGYVLCYEVLEAAFLIATNIFVREEDGWRLLHHQAGGAPSPIAATDEPPTMQ